MCRTQCLTSKTWLLIPEDHEGRPLSESADGLVAFALTKISSSSARHYSSTPLRFGDCSAVVLRMWARKVTNSSGEENWLVCPDITCSTRPENCAAFPVASAENCTTKARWRGKAYLFVVALLGSSFPEVAKVVVCSRCAITRRSIGERTSFVVRKRLGFG